MALPPIPEASTTTVSIMTLRPFRNSLLEWIYLSQTREDNDPVPFFYYAVNLPSFFFWAS